MSIKLTYTPGWDAGARTVASLSGDGVFTFSVGKSGGIVCGLNRQDNNAGYKEIDYAFYIEGHKYRVIENGVTKTAQFNFSPGAVFKITRTNGVFRYFVDDLFIYESTRASLGTFFGDCSLYAFLDSVIDAAFSEIDSALDYLSVEASIEPLSVFAIDSETFNGKIVGIGPLGVSSNEADINHGFPEVLLKAQGVEGDVNFGAIQFGPLLVIGDDLASLAPELSMGFAGLGPLHVFSYEGLLDTTSGEIGVGPIEVKAGDSARVVGMARIGPLEAGGRIQLTNYLVAEWPTWQAMALQLVDNAYAYLELPTPLLTATGRAADTAEITLRLPTPSLTTYGGIQASLKLPNVTFSATATNPISAAASLTLPALEVTATAISGSISAVALTLPGLKLQSFSGVTTLLELPIPLVIASGTLTYIASAALTLPALEFSANEFAGSIATISVELPVLEIASTGLIGSVVQAELIIPSLSLLAADGLVSLETTYAINLDSGAVTQLLIGDFDKLITAHGRLYGLRDGNLIKLEGDTDEGAPIPATVRFAPQTFGSTRAKRLHNVYISCRENDGLYLTLVQDEVASWRHQTITDTATAFGTHKVKVGRGITFHTAGLILKNRQGGRFDIGGLELLVQHLSRRPR